MRKKMLLSARLAVMAVAIATTGAGCKSSTTPASSADSGPGAGAAGGSGGGFAPDAINDNCPSFQQNIPPLTGEYAQKGKCCYRTANSTRVKAQGDGLLDVVEYRMNYYNTVNHPKSLGTDLIRGLVFPRFNNEELSLLLRIRGPRVNGKIGTGDGLVRMGQGRYNCDGTYSFFSNKAAPDFGAHRDPARWFVPEAAAKFDGTKAPYTDRVVPVWSTDPNRGPSVTPYLTSATFKLQWELISLGTAIRDWPDDGSDAALNCAGAFNTDGASWTTSGHLISYTPMAANDIDGIADLGGETMCQLVAFGAISAATSATAAYACSKASARCTPGSTVNGTPCPWVKLPESLCPETAAEQALWSCHVGDPNNPDKEKTNCTAAPVTTALDPAKGLVTTEGQCCDPLGKGTGGLPACNAYFMLNEFVIAAAEITDKDADQAQQDCHAQ